MKITSHRQLEVWQRGMDLAMEIFNLSKSFPADERFSLTDQMRRSARSVPANISEGWRKRRYAAAFVSKLNDAEGEAAETQTHIEIARRCGYLTDAQAQALDQNYEHLLAQLVTMSTRPEVWTIGEAGPGDKAIRRQGDEQSRRPVSLSPSRQVAPLKVPKS